MNFKKQLKEGVLTKNPVLVQMLGMCSTLAISTSLNTVYFLRTVITLYRKPVDTAHYPVEKGQRGILFNAALVCFALVNVALGLFSQSIVSAIVTGLSTFG